MTHRSAYLKHAKPAAPRPVNRTRIAQNVGLAVFVALTLALIAKPYLV